MSQEFLMSPDISVAICKIKVNQEFEDFLWKNLESFFFFRWNIMDSLNKKLN